MSVKKDSFEKLWQDAMHNAEESPCPNLWENIEGELNKELLANSAIRNMLLLASEKPDKVVWTNIEAELDKERKPFFIWFNKYSLTGIAALLLVSLGFLFSEKLGLVKNTEVSKVIIDHSKTPRFSKPENSNDDLAPTPKQESSEKRSSIKTTLEVSTNRELAVSTFGLEKDKSVSKIIPDSKVKEHYIRPQAAKNSIPLETKKPIVLVASLMELAKKEFDFFQNSFILDREKLKFETPEMLLASNTGFLKRSWFGFSSGLSPFNPNFEIKNFERAALTSNNSTPNSAFEAFNKAESAEDPEQNKFAFPFLQPYNDVKSGTAINLGFDYGKRIKKHLSIESGVRYLSGRSIVTSNVYSYNKYTGDIRTFLESNYIKKDQTTVFDNTIIASSGEVTSDYKFITVPVQLGYHLPITKKIETSATLGLSGDVIISNVFDNISEGGSKLTSANSAYRAINLSGIGSINFDYAVRDNWQVTIGSRVQQTLTSGVEQSQSFSFKPRYIGVNTGINYRFK